MTASSPATSQTNPLKTLALALFLISPLLVYAFTFSLPPASDFLDSFFPAAHVPLDPYGVPSYLNPPWVALLLYPLTFLPERVAQAIIAFLNLAMTLLLISRYKGNRWSFLLTITSAPFLSLLVNGNMDWLPMMAFLLPANWGLAVMLSKPQTGIMAGLVWFKQAKRKIPFLFPAAGLLLASFLIWGWWVSRMFHQSLQSGGRAIGPWNISPFPWLIPLGLFLLHQAWKREDELIAVAATLCLTPYFAVYSLTIFFAMLAARTPRLSFIAWIILWIFFLALRWIALRYYAT
jgi:hypothetical protein